VNQHEGRHDTRPTEEVKLQNVTFIEQKSKTETGEDQREKAEAELGMTCQLSRL